MNRDEIDKVVLAYHNKGSKASSSGEIDPDVAKFLSYTNYMNSKEHIEKFKKYEADFKQYLLAKYFSDNTIFGGNIFDVKMNIDGQTIMASRLPPYQSYLDPATFDLLLSGKESLTLVKGGAEASTGDSNVKSSTQGN